MTNHPPKTVLVVEDDSDTRELLVSWLEDDPRCRQVISADTAEGGVEAAAQQHADAVLLDYNLGSQTSAAILPTLRRTLPDALIVVHTASHDAALMADVIDLGADMIVEKGSVSIAALVDLVLRR